MKILLLGTDQGNFIFQLCKSIRAHSQAFQFFTIGSLSLKSDEPLTNHISTIPNRATPWSFVRAVIRSLFDKTFWEVFVYILLIERKLGKLAHFVYHWNRERAVFYTHGSFRNMDIFQFHYIQYSYLRMIHFVPKEKKVICTFWGSDLLRTGDSFNHYFVSKSLERADVITVQSPELREVLLAKFGRHLKTKVQALKFSAERKLYDEIDSLTPERIEHGAAALRLRNDRVNIIVGHNASPFNQHLAIVQALAKMKYKDRVYLTFPFAYGIDPVERKGYIAEIGRLLDGASFEYQIMEGYLSWVDVAIMRVRGDIMIHTPESDALSGAATEAMYAGNMLVTGDWLPYGPFVRSGLVYWKISEFDELPALIDGMVVDLPAFKARCADNREQIRAHFFPEVTSVAWVDLLRKLEG
jgi:hypothetical protein